MLPPVVASLLERRSVRAYTGQAIDKDTLRTIFDAAVHAPSAHNSRPWHFVVFTTPEAKGPLCQALSDKFSEDLRKASVPVEEAERRIRRSQGIFSQAAVLTVAFGRALPPQNQLADGPEIERLLVSQSVALACGQLLLAAHAFGIGGCWFAAPLFCPEAVCAACQVDSAMWTPQAILTLGYPAEAPKEKPPLVADDYVSYR